MFSHRSCGPLEYSLQDFISCFKKARKRLSFTGVAVHAMPAGVEGKIVRLSKCFGCSKNYVKPPMPPYDVCAASGVEVVYPYWW